MQVSEIKWKQKEKERGEGAEVLWVRSWMFTYHLIPIPWLPVAMVQEVPSWNSAIRKEI